MEDDTLKELFKRAADISKSVPEPLREAAFNRALDALLDTKGAPKPEGKTSTRRSKGSPQNPTDKGAEKDVNYLLEHLDRTAYPQLSSAPRVLERALHVLRIANDEFSIDGLGATDIAKVLTEKFRLRATKQAVQQALDSAREHVDRVGGKGRTVYRIMHAGEQYLDSGESQTAQGETPRSSRKGGRTKSAQNKQSSGNGTSKKATKKKTSGGRPGPRAALDQLVAEGFFDSPRRVADMQQHLTHTKAHTYKTGELASTLTRMLRDGVLKRDRAEDGQYEYKHQ